MKRFRCAACNGVFHNTDACPKCTTIADIEARKAEVLAARAKRMADLPVVTMTANTPPPPDDPETPKPAPKLCSCGRSLYHGGRCWYRRGEAGPTKRTTAALERDLSESTLCHCGRPANHRGPHLVASAPEPVQSKPDPVPVRALSRDADPVEDFPTLRSAADDRELNAVAMCLTWLWPLEQTARARALAYLGVRLGGSR